MLLTPTAKYLAYAKGLAKTMRWRVYIRKTNNLGDAIDSGTWLEVTDRVQGLDTQRRALEYDFGQFTANSLQLTAEDILWWESNVFSATEKYLEVKIQLTLGLRNDTASDVLYTFSGFIDRVGKEATETADAFTVTAYTAQDAGSRIAAENISTQYVNQDVDGSGTDALILTEIRGLFVTDANITSFPLKVGTHTITYDYNGGTRRAKLDNGRWVTLNEATTTLLGDAENSFDDEQRLNVYVQDLDDLPGGQLTDKVIVITEGDTLPRQWYKYVGLASLLRKMFDEIGISTAYFDDLDMDVAPAPAPGVAKLSYVDSPPNDTAVQGLKGALTTDGTSLYTAVGHKIYRRGLNVQDDYELLATMTAGDRVSRLIYNARNNHLWIFYASAGDGNEANAAGRVRQLDLDTDTLSSAVTLNTAVGMTWHYSIAVIDFEYDTAQYVYGLLFTDADHTVDAGRLRFVDGGTLAVSTIFDGTDYGLAGNTFSTIKSQFMFIRNDNEVWFKAVYGSSPVEHELLKAHVDGTGAWVNDGAITSDLGPYDRAAFNSVNERIYHWISADGSIGSHEITSSTVTSHLASFEADVLETIAYLNGLIYFTAYKLAGLPIDITRAYKLYTIDDLDDAVERAIGGFSLFSAMTFADDLIFGIDPQGRLWQYGMTVAMYMPLADFEGKSVTQAIYDTLSPFLLISTISPIKKAFIFRRGNAAGVPQTTGNTLDLTTNEAAEITEVTQHVIPAELVSVSNGSTTKTFNGTKYGANVLSDAHKVEINSSYIPDEIVQDVCYYAYQFFKTARNLYTVRLEKMPLFHFEPLDGAQLSLSDTKIGPDAEGPIYAVELEPDGSMNLEVLK